MELKELEAHLTEAIIAGQRYVDGLRDFKVKVQDMILDQMSDREAIEEVMK